VVCVLDDSGTGVRLYASQADEEARAWDDYGFFSDDWTR